MCQGEMGEGASILLLVAGLDAASAARLDGRLEETFAQPNGFELVAVGAELPPDVDASALVRAHHARGLVEVAASRGLGHVELRVGTGEPGSWEGRALDFDDSEPVEARERSIALVALSMWPEHGGRAERTLEPERPAPPAPPDPAPPSAAPPRRTEPRLRLEAGATAALGAPVTVGGYGAVGVRVVAGLWVGAGAAVRAGSLASHVSTLEVPLWIGAGWRVPCGPVELGPRLDAVTSWRQVTVAEGRPPSRQRLLGGARFGVEMGWHVTRRWGVHAFVAAEADGGRLRIEVDRAERYRTQPLRAYVEVGPTLTF